MIKNNQSKMTTIAPAVQYNFRCRSFLKTRSDSDHSCSTKGTLVEPLRADLICEAGLNSSILVGYAVHHTFS